MAGLCEWPAADYKELAAADELNYLGLGGSVQRLRHTMVKGVRTRSLYSGWGSAECALSFVEKAARKATSTHTQHGSAESLGLRLGLSLNIEASLIINRR